MTSHDTADAWTHATGYKVDASAPKYILEGTVLGK